MLVEQTGVAQAVLPVAQLKDHLRLGTGFADDGYQDAVLETCLRAALSAVEDRTGKALFQRRFQWSLTAWRDLARQVLPLAPVNAITKVSIIDRAGSETVLDVSKYRLERDAHRPAVVATTLVLPSIPVGGTAEIVFDAGYAADWAGMPPGIAQAVMFLAAHYYENRHMLEAQSGFPGAVASLLEPYRELRLFRGRG